MKQLTKQFALSASALAAALLITACGGGASTDDTTAPTVTITDSVADTTATGNVTFTFTFSESVGASFTVDDITVTGGVKSTFTMADTGLSATLLVVPTANTTGTISVAVAADKFKDAANVVNTLSATATQAYNTVTEGTALNFETGGKGAAFTWKTFENDTNPAVEIVANPNTTGINSSTKVAKFTTLATGAPYAGFESKHGTDLGTVKLSAANALVKIMVYKTVISDVGIKFANATDGSTGEIKVPNTKVNEWEELTFDFSAVIGGVNDAIDQIIFMPDFKARSADNIIYIDNITFSAKPVAATFPVSFDEATPPKFAGFNGAEDTSIKPGPTGGTGDALKIIRNTGDTWAGAKLTEMSVGITTTNNTVSAKVYSPTAGIPFELKLEGSKSDTGEIAANEAVVVGWQTLTWTVPSGKIGPVRDVVVFLPNNRTVGAGEIYYIDDIKIVAGAVAPVVVSTLPVTFDGVGVTYKFTGFGGTSAELAADPAGGANKVAKAIKSATAESWAGVTFSTGASDSIATVPFTSTAKSMTLRVYSPASGIPVLLKLEDASNKDKNTEVQVNTTAANAWQTLTFTFAGADVTTTYNKASVFYNFGTTGATGGGGTFYFDDLTFVAP
jgi:hypothetical protein